ncbi:MAG TPA: DUF350 domain-containing protein, partial [Blastocatellia bacterium]
GCGLQVSDDLKFCRQCGANLQGAREGMMSRSAEEKSDWGASWAANIRLAQEIQERQRGTPEERRLNEIKGGVITSLVGVGVMIFLYYFFEVLTKGKEGGEILRILWLTGIIPFLVGVGLLINGLFVSRRLVKPEEQRTQTTDSASPAPPALLAQTTNQLVIDPSPLAGVSVTEDPTAHLTEPVAAPPRREAG